MSTPEEKKEVDRNDISDIEIENDPIPYHYYRFSFAPSLISKETEYTRVVIVNRWLWMTDDSALRNIYPPLLSELEKSGFKEISPAIVITKRDINNARETLSKIGLVEETSILNSPLKHIKK